MPDDGHQLPWTEEQWAIAQRTVQEAASKARVASSFLPLVGPLPPGQASVPWLKMGLAAPKPPDWFNTGLDRLDIDDSVTLALTTIACNVSLTTQQVQDPDLASARQMLGRAAVLIGRLEDAIVFNGQAGAGQGPPAAAPAPGIWAVQGGGAYIGLLAASTLQRVPVAPLPKPTYGDRLLEGVVKAIELLEEKGQYGPFSCVLGDGLYLAANTPNQGTLVLPSDRIVPFLDGGPLLRSSSVASPEGVVVALAGSPIDVVVATDLHVSYVQRSIEPRYVLRISERFVLRVKQADAVCHLVPSAPARASRAGASKTAQTRGGRRKPPSTGARRTTATGGGRKTTRTGASRATATGGGRKTTRTGGRKTTRTAASRKTTATSGRKTSG
jgi:uncharacterized linocin/CFP29 family protein